MPGDIRAPPPLASVSSAFVDDADDDASDDKICSMSLVVASNGTDSMASKLWADILDWPALLAGFLAAATTDVADDVGGNGAGIGGGGGGGLFAGGLGMADGSAHIDIAGWRVNWWVKYVKWWSGLWSVFFLFRWTAVIDLLTDASRDQSGRRLDSFYSLIGLTIVDHITDFYLQMIYEMESIRIRLLFMISFCCSMSNVIYHYWYLISRQCAEGRMRKKKFEAAMRSRRLSDHIIHAGDNCMHAQLPSGPDIWCANEINIISWFYERAWRCAKHLSMQSSVVRWLFRMWIFRKCDSQKTASGRAEPDWRAGNQLIFCSSIDPNLIIS